MTDSLKLAEMQRTSIEFERQRHLANWFIKSSPHMATPSTPLSTNVGVNCNGGGGGSGSNGGNPTISTSTAATQSGNGGTKNGGGTITTTNPLFFLMSSNGNHPGGGSSGVVGSSAINGGSGTAGGSGKHGGNSVMSRSSQLFTSQTNLPLQIVSASASSAAAAGGVGASHHHPEGRKPKLRRFNSHDTSANMFSVADFENARLARRNEIEMKQRMQQRIKMNSLSSCGGAGSSGGGGGGGGFGSIGGGGDCSTGDSKGSKYSNDSQTDPLAVDIFLDRYSLPRVVRISYKTKFSHETLQSSSSNGSSTSTQSSSGTGTGTGTGSSLSSSAGGGGVVVNNNNNNNNNLSMNTSSSNNQHSMHNSSGSSSGVSGGGGGNNKNNSTSNSNEQQNGGGELFLLYRLIRQRHIYHGHNAKTGVANRKKGVMIPQEFPGFFSLLNDKGLPTATLYTTLIQLVRERVYKFVSVDNLSAFTESQNSSNGSATNGSGSVDSTTTPNYGAPPARPQYIKTTARGGQVFRLLAVFEDGKQDTSSTSAAGAMSAKISSSGREKEKGRYAQLLNENRQVFYVSLSTKGKFYEIEPGVPQILQKLGGGSDAHKKINPDCVHKITALVTPQKELPITLRFISGPAGCANTIPENLTITRITTENVVIACPIEDVEAQSPLHLRKLHLTAEMTLLKCSLGFENEQRMLANQNVQNILKFCQFNCDQFLKMVEVEILNRPERSGSKSRVDGLKILKPLHLPKLLRREKTSIAHEKEDSIIFLSKNDLANLEAKEEQQQQQNRISDKMKVFQSTKKKWFRRSGDKHVTLMTSLDLDVQAKRMSMERYNDMSKLLQERFGKNRASGNAATSNAAGDESVSERSTSEIGCSDTETTTVATTIRGKKKGMMASPSQRMLQKSLSLQDVEFIGKPDLLSSARGRGGRQSYSFDRDTETISETTTDPEDFENRPPQSFITEKLYSEFHVKTRQYSKSSSSLHQLLHFAVPQKMNVIESKRSLAQLKQQQQYQRNSSSSEPKSPSDKRLEFNIGEPVTGRRAAGATPLLPLGAMTSLNGLNGCVGGLIEDDLPYSSVRDSLILSSDESSSDNHLTNVAALNFIDYTKENIYAEICHDSAAHPNSRDPISTSTTSTSICGDYSAIAGSGGAAISRVQINCSQSSPVSYHTVFFGANEHQLAGRSEQPPKSSASSTTDRDNNNKNKMAPPATAAITASGVASGVSCVTVECFSNGGGRVSDNTGATDNIYNTLK